jgi:hypothetical protein
MSEKVLDAHTVEQVNSIDNPKDVSCQQHISENLQGKENID